MANPHQNQPPPILPAAPHHGAGRRQTRNSQRTGPGSGAPTGLPAAPPRARRRVITQAARDAARQTLGAQVVLQNMIPLMLPPGATPHIRHWPRLRRLIQRQFGFTIGPAWPQPYDTLPSNGPGPNDSISGLWRFMLPVACQNQRTPNLIAPVAAPVPIGREFTCAPYGAPTPCNHTYNNHPNLHYVRCQGGKLGLASAALHGDDHWICSDCADHEERQLRYFRWCHSFVAYCRPCSEWIEDTNQLPGSANPCHCRKLDMVKNQPQYRRKPSRPVKGYLCGPCRWDRFLALEFDAVRTCSTNGFVPMLNAGPVIGGVRRLRHFVNDDPNVVLNGAQPLTTPRNICPRADPDAPCAGRVLHSWQHATPNQRARMFRLCLNPECQGEVREADIHTAGYNNRSCTQ